MSGVEDWVDLRRAFERWERDLSFFAIDRLPRSRPDALYGDDPRLTRDRINRRLDPIRHRKETP